MVMVLLIMTYINFMVMTSSRGPRLPIKMSRIIIILAFLNIALIVGDLINITNDTTVYYYKKGNIERKISKDEYLILKKKQDLEFKKILEK